LLAALYKKNKNLIDQLKNTDGSLEMKKVQTIDWENQFKSLDYSEAEKTWKEMDLKVDADLDHFLFYLFDRDYITIADVKNGRASAIYPYTMYMIARYNMDSVTLRQTVKNIVNLFSQ
jgi:hypothetical protein